MRTHVPNNFTNLQVADRPAAIVRARNAGLGGGAVTGNAEDVMAQASGVGVAQRGSGGTLRSRSGGGGSGQAGSLGGLRGSNAAGHAQSEGTTVVERRIRGHIRLEGNAAGLVADNRRPRGTRSFGPVGRELRDNRFMRIVSLAPEVL